MANIASASKAMRGVGYLGLAVGAIDSADTIYQACNEEENGQCARVATVELGGFAGGWGAATGATVAVSAGLAGVVSAPVLIVVAIGASLVVGAIGTTAGKGLGEGLYYGSEKLVKLYEQWSE